jgi:hypothetical protein
MREKRNAYRVLMGNPEGIKKLECPGLCNRVILKWIIENRMICYGLYSCGLVKESVAGFCEHVNESLVHKMLRNS